MGSQETPHLKVIMLPWLGHGHINPYLELAKKLSKKNFSIYFCSTPVNLTSIKPKLGQNYPSIHLIEINLPSLPDLPSHHHTTNGLPPHLMPLLIQAFHMAGPSFLSEALETIKPNLVMYDIMQPWVKSVTMTYSTSIPVVHFQTAGVAAVMLAVCVLLNITNKFPEISFREWEVKKMAALGGGFEDVIYDGLDQSCDIILFKLWEGSGGKYVDYLSEICKKKVISVGPLLVEESINKDVDKDDEIIEWLNGKEKSSTVFVSFGSENFLSKNEIEELALGLEGSNVNFIWVIRFPPGEKIITKVEEISLPEGFLEKVKGKGKILFGWAPQARILKHSSIGGFVSHCGWSSILESLSFGVPIIAVPLQYDQPLNARMLVEYGVATEVSRHENGDLDSEAVAKAIREVVVEESGEDVRKKARELGEKIRVKGDEDIDFLVEELQTFCLKYNNLG